MLPNGVWALSLGRLSKRYLPLTFLGKRTPFLLYGIMGFGMRMNVVKSFVFPRPIDAPCMSSHQTM